MFLNHYHLGENQKQNAVISRLTPTQNSYVSIFGDYRPSGLCMDEIQITV